MANQQDGEPVYNPCVYRERFDHDDCEFILIDCAHPRYWSGSENDNERWVVRMYFRACRIRHVRPVRPPLPQVPEPTFWQWAGRDGRHTGSWHAVYPGERQWFFPATTMIR